MSTMESLSFLSSSPIKPVNRFNLISRINPEFTSIKHVGLPCFSTQRSRRLCVSLAEQSFSGRNEGGFSSSKDGSSAFQEQEQEQEQEREIEIEREDDIAEKGVEFHAVGPVTDSSGSIVAFRLFSQSQSDESDVLKSHVNGDLDKQEEEHEVQGKDGIRKDELRVREKSDGDEEEDFLTPLSRSFTFEQSEVGKEAAARKALEISQSEENTQKLLEEIDIERQEKTPSKVLKEEEHEVQGKDGIGKDEHRVREKSNGDEEEDFLTRLSRSFTFEQSEVENEEEALEALEICQSEENTQKLLKEIDLERQEKTPSKVTFNIVFVTSEAAPYSKTGGLGDVCGSLPISLATRGHRVMVVSPRYLHGTAADKKYAGAFDANCRIKVNCFGGEQEVAFFHEYRAGVDWVFVDHPSYHRPGNPYGDSFGAFGDNQFRFTLLSHAACEAPLVLPLGGYTYGEKCLFLVNDWHAGLVPTLLAAKYRPYGVYKDARSVLVIHNLSHQGVEPAVTYDNLGLPTQWYGALEWVFPEWARAHALDKGEAVNILKGAIVTSDRILTVSKGYSWEITTVEGGYGLHELLSNRMFVLNGITNGIDTSEWDPSTDEHIASHYSIDDLSGKAQCKAALQKELGLPLKPECPLIGFIGRLDYQKGVDLIQAAVPEIMQDNVQLVMLGSGDSRYENWMRETEVAYRDNFRGWVGFNVPISHRITAGCDMLLMPSRFEPCGLNQLYAMRYGTIPVVHATGGLRDTVETYNPFAVGDYGTGRGTGWAFSPLTKEGLLSAVGNALVTYREYTECWVGLMKGGMKQDFSWDSAAAQYEQVFKWAFIDPPYC